METTTTKTMSTDEKTLWDALNDLDEKKLNEIINRIDKNQLKNTAFDYLRSCIFDGLEFNVDGRLEILGGTIDTDDHTITIGGDTYQIYFQKVKK